MVVAFLALFVVLVLWGWDGVVAAIALVVGWALFLAFWAAVLVAGFFVLAMVFAT